MLVCSEDVGCAEDDSEPANMLVDLVTGISVEVNCSPMRGES